MRERNEDTSNSKHRNLEQKTNCWLNSTDQASIYGGIWVEWDRGAGKGDLRKDGTMGWGMSVWGWEKEQVD